jgi:hypothetical protein
MGTNVILLSFPYGDMRTNVILLSFPYGDMRTSSFVSLPLWFFFPLREEPLSYLLPFKGRTPVVSSSL